MNVSIKSFDVIMEVKNKGVEFEVRDTQGKFLGDCIVTKTGLTWCQGKIQPPNGKKVSWNKLIEWIQSD